MCSAHDPRAQSAPRTARNAPSAPAYRSRRIRCSTYHPRRIRSAYHPQGNGCSANLPRPLLHERVTGGVAKPKALVRPSAKALRTRVGRPKVHRTGNGPFRPPVGLRDHSRGRRRPKAVIARGNYRIDRCVYSCQQTQRSLPEEAGVPSSTHLHRPAAGHHQTRLLTGRAA
jgi:hypothetical protein